MLSHGFTLSSRSATDSHRWRDGPGASRSRVDAQRQALHDRVVPSVRQRPGFVSGTWRLDRDAETSVAVITFASREAAVPFRATS